MTPLTADAARDRATRTQIDAADPKVSAWVSANAGSGKTRVLTNRVARLLLDGTDPRRVLCLTYTKAAAAEMSGRLFKMLGAWSMMSDDALAAELTELQSAAIDTKRLKGARRLFAKALETPGGLQIETIHGFCQRILKRFPGEAGTIPDFQVLDEAGQADLADAALRFVMTDPNGDIGQTVARLLSVRTETTIRSLAEDSLRNRAAIEAFLMGAAEKGGPGGALSIALGLEPEEDETLIRNLQLNDPSRDENALSAVADEMLRAGGKTNEKHGAAIKQFVLAGDRASHWQAYRSTFLTDKRTIRNRLATKAVYQSAPFAEQLLSGEAARVHQLVEKEIAALTRSRSLDALVFARALIEAYTALKHERRALDYDDLISYTKQLVSAENQMWVQFKLDGGIDHILIDEAQDTSPDQWQIIEKLGAEFFRDQAEIDRERTIFAVGDEKQSIYSFQGAEPQMFAQMRSRFGDRAQAAGRPWLPVELDVSFRSGSHVLETVDRTFDGPGARASLTADAENIAHIVEKTDITGFVELWPPFVKQKAEAPDPWLAPVDQTPTTAPEVQLAARIAKQIRDWVDKGEWLTRYQRGVRAGDIMVLVRDRDQLFFEIIKALKVERLDVAGMDRMVLRDELAVLDLAALARFCLLPSDDLSLAEVLKGPLFRLSDEDLLQFAPNRSEALWQAFRSWEDPRVTPIVSRLDALRRVALMARPYEFLTACLSDGGYRAFLTALGEEAGEVIEELLSLSLVYEGDGPPSLLGFFIWLEETSGTLKRDMEKAGEKIRVMTVHGAKGLEAPIVILPQTHVKQKRRRASEWLRDKTTGAWIWPASGGEKDLLSQELEATNKERDEHEALRLLYVAMTRAEERLYVCGITSARDRPDESWYGRIKHALGPIAQEVPVWPGQTGLRFGDRVVGAGERREKIQPTEIDTPDWVHGAAPQEPTRLRRTPSGLLEQEEHGLTIPSPLDLTQSALSKGKLVHRILELVPTAPREKWPVLCRRLVAEVMPEANSDAAERLIKEIRAVLEDPAFADVFGPESSAEVPLVGVVQSGDGLPVSISGQIDRLVVKQNHVLAVDFKTGRMPEPGAPLPRAYLSQMAAYRVLLKNLYPRKQVRTALLWTAGPRLTALDDRDLDVIEVTQNAAMDPKTG